MKFKVIFLSAMALAVGFVAWLGVMAHAQQTLHAKSGIIWMSFEEDGHHWMVGANKEHARADDDAGFARSDFGKGYAIKVQDYIHTILFHNCCTTNITIGTNYMGTVQIGTNVFRVSELLKR